jgi:predicted secreted protein
LGAAGLAQFDELKFGKIKECEAFAAPASFIFHRKHPDLVTWTPHKPTGSIKIMKIFIEKNSDPIASISTILPFSKPVYMNIFGFLP